MTCHPGPLVAVLLAVSVIPASGAGAQAVDTDSLRRAYRAEAEATARRVAEAATVFANRQLAAERRLAAVAGIGGFDRARDVEATTAIVFEPSEPGAVRVRAVELVAQRAAIDESLRDRLIDLLERQETPRDLRRAIMDGVAAALFSWHPAPTEPDRVTAALRRLARDPDPEVRRLALRVLAAHGDTEARQLLERGLLSPGDALLPPVEAVLLLGLSDPAPHYPVLRRVLARPPDAQTRVAAVRLLAGDAESREQLDRILQDSREALEVRQAALGALAVGDPMGFPHRVLVLVGDEAVPRDLRVRAIKTVEVQRTSRDSRAIGARRQDEFDRRMRQLLADSRDQAVRAAADRYVRRTSSAQ
jgi:hypothetical protein